MIKSFEITQGPKQAIRDFLTEEAAKLPTCHKIFTLPGKEALCVQTFRQKYPNATYRAVERIQKDWNIITSKGIDCVLGTIQDYANQHTHPTLHHDVIFLDYFSHLNDDVLEGVKLIVGNPNIVHPGKQFLLGITLSKAMRHGKSSMLDFIKENVYLTPDESPANTLDMVGSALHNYIETSRVESQFRSIQCLKEVEYQASETSSHMYFFCYLTKG